MTLDRVFLQSRTAFSTVIWMAALAAVGWAVLGATSEPCLALLVKTITPLGAAVAISAGARSPFGDVERSAGSLLTRLRSVHVGGLLGIASICLVVAATAEPGNDAMLMSIRNLAGFTGLALLASVWFGGAYGWLIPFTYGLVTFLAAMPDNRAGAWAWPIRAGDHVGAALVAGGLLVGGVWLAARRGCNPD